MNFTIPLYRENVYKLPDIRQNPEHSHAWTMAASNKVDKTILEDFERLASKVPLPVVYHLSPFSEWVSIEIYVKQIFISLSLKNLAFK